MLPDIHRQLYGRMAVVPCSVQAFIGWAWGLGLKGLGFRVEGVFKGAFGVRRSGSSSFFREGGSRGVGT